MPDYVRTILWVATFVWFTGGAIYLFLPGLARSMYLGGATKRESGQSLKRRGVARLVRGAILALILFLTGARKVL